MTTVVRVSGLGKVYKLYWGPRSLLREVLFGTRSHDVLHALRDVSFEVQAGEAFGIVGDNGAGKSTLLKILTGTCFPTTGSVSVEGRISALLELGAGFHPEFTGRDNIYFSGALMGLEPDEVDASVEEIIAFSELADFIDQPVKTYSSGMYLRLGFSVATGFEPDVLIIDEALAVGDQHFVKKCTDRILDFRRSGKTLLFCSHNLYQIKTLCDRALWLERGKVAGLGSSTEIVDAYTDLVREAPPTGKGESLRRHRVCWVEKVRVLDGDGVERTQFETGETLQVDVEARFDAEFRGKPGIGVAVVRNDDVLVYVTANTIDGVSLERLGPDRYRCRLVFDDLPLLSGSYYLNVVTTDQGNLQAYSVVERVAAFQVRSDGGDFGIVRLGHRWPSTQGGEGE